MGKSLASKALDFDSASNHSNADTATMVPGSDADTATVNVTSTDDDTSLVMGPTTRRKWTEWVNRPPLLTSESESQNESPVRCLTRMVLHGCSCSVLCYVT